MLNSGENNSNKIGNTGSAQNKEENIYDKKDTPTKF